MTTFLELMVAGLSTGMVYALIALGFVIIFKATEIVNFAHGSFLLAGGLVIAALHTRIGFLGALLAGIAAAALLAYVVERLLVRPLRGQSHISLAILTLGLDILITTEVIRRIGIDVKSLGGPWADQVVRIGSLTVPQSSIWAAVTSLAIITAFFAAFRWTGWGISIRAAAEDPEAAALMGIRLGRVSATVWMLAGALAAVACLFLTSFPAAGLDTNTGSLAFVAFTAAIIGGLDSTHGAVLGGLTVGLAQSLAGGYQDHLLFLGRGFADTMPFVVMLVVLLIRPSGLFGTKELTRV